MTISVELINSQTKQPVEGLYLGLYTFGSSNPLATLLTDAQGKGQFEVDSAGTYTILQPTTRDIEYFVCHQQVEVSANQDVTLTIDADPYVEPTQAQRDSFVAASLQAITRRFNERLAEAGGDATLETAARGELVAELQDIINFVGVAPMECNVENSNVCCSQCMNYCVNSSDPNCVYNCRYMPTPCKQNC